MLKKLFIGLLTSILNASNHTKCEALSNRKCKIQPTLINLHPNEHTQGSCHISFADNLDRRVRSCNNLNDLSNKVCAPNKPEDLNLSMFNMVTGINESKTLSKHISCKCKCKFNGTKCNSNQIWNNDKSLWECKNQKKHCVSKERLYLESYYI